MELRVTDTISGPSSKGKINEIMPRFDVLVCETFGIKLFWIRKILRIVMQPANGYYNLCTSVDRQIGSWYLIGSRSHPREVRKDWVLPHGFYAGNIWEEKRSN